jgi:hypothetical protein
MLKNPPHGGFFLVELDGFGHLFVSLRQTALTAPMQAQTPPATSTDVRSSILTPPFQ